MDIPADKCAHMSLTRMPGPIPLYRCSACSSGFVLNAYLPIPPGRFLEVARQFAGSEKLFERVQREIAAADNGIVLPNPAQMRDLNGDGEPLTLDDERRKRNSTPT